MQASASERAMVGHVVEQGIPQWVRGPPVESWKLGLVRMMTASLIDAEWMQSRR